MGGPDAPVPVPVWAQDLWKGLASIDSAIDAGPAALLVPVATTLEVEDVGRPGKVARVDAQKYHTLRVALMQVLPQQEPGLSHSGMCRTLRAHLEGVLPAEGVPWWVACIRNDLEAKGELVREDGPVPRWHRRVRSVRQRR